MLLYLFRKVLQRSAHVGSAAELGGFKASDDVLESGCHHKILLLKTQLLTLEKLTHTHTHIIKKKGGLKWIFQTDFFKSRLDFNSISTNLGLLHCTQNKHIPHTSFTHKPMDLNTSTKHKHTKSSI